MTINLPVNFFERIETLRFVEKYDLTLELELAKLVLVELWFLFGNTVRDCRCRRSDLLIFLNRQYSYLGREQVDAFVALLIDCEVLREAEDGFIELVDFAQYNQHLLPHRKTLQERGGQTRRLRKAWDDAARQGRDLFAYLKSTGAEIPEGMQGREDMFSAAWALAVSLHAVSGLSLTPGCEVPSSELMLPSMAVLARHRADARMAVLRYLDGRRGDDSVCKDPRFILENFDEFVDKAQRAGS